MAIIDVDLAIMCLRPDGYSEISRYGWERLIERVMTVNDSPEARLVVAIVASGIEEEWCEAFFDNRKHFTGCYWDNAHRRYCSLIGVNASWLLDRAKEAVKVVDDRRAFYPSLNKHRQKHIQRIADARAKLWDVCGLS